MDVKTNSYNVQYIIILAHKVNVKGCLDKHHSSQDLAIPDSTPRHTLHHFSSHSFPLLLCPSLAPPEPLTTTFTTDTTGNGTMSGERANERERGKG